jgi:hypothetical protein
VCLRTCVQGIDETSEMKLPNAQLAVIDQEKVVGYLLNPAHPDNAGKAAFFFSLGFNPAEWAVVVRAFHNLAQTTDVTRSMESPHGQKFIVDGEIETPSGKRTAVRTIWIVDRGFDRPRLVTAYPY